MRTFSEQGWAAPGAAQPARSTVTTPGGGQGNSSVPWPGRPLRPVGAGGFGEAERRNLAALTVGQVPPLSLAEAPGAYWAERAARPWH